MRSRRAGPVVSAIDLGSSAVRVGLVSLDGQLLSVKSVPVDTAAPYPGWAEQRPDEWWDGVGSACREVRREVPDAWAQVAAVCVTGHAGACVAMDRKGRVLRPATMYSDQRADREASEANLLRARSGRADQNSAPYQPSNFGARIAWIREHEPEVYEQITVFLSSTGYLVFRLTGVQIWDCTQAAHTQLATAPGEQWDLRTLKSFGIDTNRLGPIRKPTDAVGHVSSRAELETGLRRGVPVIAGAVDFPTSVLGSGAIYEGDSALVMGTSFGLATIVNDPPTNTALLTTPTVDGRLLVGGAIDGAGASMSWISGLVLREQDGPHIEPTASAFERLERLASECSAGAHGVIYYPFVSGSRTVSYDPLARGALVGITHSTDLGVLARAVMEGCAFAIRDIERALSSLGSSINSIHASGGAAASVLWRQIIADILSIRLITSSTNSAALLGSGMLAFGALGHYDSLDASVSQMRGTTTLTQPNLEPVLRYDKVYSNYRAVRDALTPFPTPAR